MMRQINIIVCITGSIMHRLAITIVSLLKNITKGYADYAPFSPPSIVTIDYIESSLAGSHSQWLEDSVSV
jgi:hypothetical protein